MRCETCKYWTKPRERRFRMESPWFAAFGTCKRIPHREAVGHWAADDHGDTVWTAAPEYADVTAMACDGSGYHAEVETRPEHFCSMYQEA